MTLNGVTKTTVDARYLCGSLIASWFCGKTLKQNYTLQHVALLVGG